MTRILLFFCVLFLLSGCNGFRGHGFTQGLQSGAVTGHNLVNPYQSIPYPSPVVYGVAPVYRPPVHRTTTCTTLSGTIQCF